MFKILEKLTAKNKKQDDIRMPSHLSAAEQKQVQTVIDRARGDRTVPHSAQESIPFQRMFPDGICRVTDNYYTKTIQFQDINYQLAQQEDQTAIFEEWCSFLNFFDSSIRFELSFMNMATDASNFEKMVRIPYQKDHFNPVRTEYSTMLRRQLAQGNNGLTKTKYLTFGIEAESMKQAKPRLIHIEIDLMNNFKLPGIMLIQHPAALSENMVSLYFFLSPQRCRISHRRQCASLLHWNLTIPPSLWPDRELRKYHCPCLALTPPPVAIRHLLLRNRYRPDGLHGVQSKARPNRNVPEE